MKENVFVSAVVYMNNGREELKPFYEKIVPKLKEMFSKMELIFVDDASTDGSNSVLKECASGENDFAVSVLHMSFYQGLELAMNAGRDLAIGDYVIEFDSMVVDYDLSLLEEVFGQVKSGYDIVAAAPKNVKRPFSKLFYRLFRSMNTADYQMRTETFRILTRRAINQITAMNAFVPYRKAVYANSGYALKTCLYENAGQKTFDRQEQKYRRNLAMESILLFTHTGYHFSIGMTVMMMIITVIVALYACVVYLFGNPIEGWTTTILFLAFAFFGLFGILTIIVKYLSLILNMVFRKRKYAVSGIERVGKETTSIFHSENESGKA